MSRLRESDPRLVKDDQGICRLRRWRLVTDSSGEPNFNDALCQPG
ncbi:MAG: hypothetical protein AAB217_12365 [Chloroflexota bacterium]